MSIQTDTLSNGLTIVTESMPQLESASLGFWVGAGARHETAAQNGIAHFMEHMAFKGTNRRTALQIAETIEDVGGYLNAYTSRDTTAYYSRVLAGDVPLALDVLGDILLHPSLDEAEVETERGVILQEIGQALDTPDDIIFDWQQEIAYPNQPMGRSILGTDNHVRAFKRDDLSGFIGRHYSPDRIVLAAAGAVEHDKIVRQAEAMFAHTSSLPAPDVAPAVFSGGEHRVVKDLEQAHVSLCLPAPDYKADDFFSAQVFAIALGGGMSSRLFQELRERRGLCYSVMVSASAGEDNGMITLYAGTSESDVAELTTVAMDEIRRAAEDLSQAEIDRARVQLKAGMLMGLESASARAERLARSTSIWGRVLPLAETIAKIDAVNRTSVRDFAIDLLSKPMAGALYGPVGAAPSVAALSAQLAA